jgi:ceramide glucosyltransferase
VSVSHHTWMSFCGTALAAAVAVYTVLAAYAVRTRLKPYPAVPPLRKDAPVTIFKPLCGAEHELYECLRSFCDQDYPRFQIVFGVSDPDDPAIGVVARLAREFPAVDMQIAVDRRQHGTSRKVSNLINMMPYARHDLFVISDSDVRVDRDYLARIVVPLADPAVGIVTCPYLGRPRKGLWSTLGSLFINDWFTPSVRVAAMFGSRAFAFGATIAIRRHVLRRIGGFASIANQLADDYRLGELTRALGLRTVLSDVVVETCVDEPTLSELVHHELRWLRTIRIVRPVGYSLSLVTFGVPVAAVGCLLAGLALPALTLLVVTALARIMLHLRVRGTFFPPAHQLLLLPVRDLLSLALWAWSFATRRVQWRDDSFDVARDGSADPVVRDAA